MEENGSESVGPIAQLQRKMLSQIHIIIQENALLKYGVIPIISARSNAQLQAAGGRTFCQIRHLAAPLVWYTEFLLLTFFLRRHNRKRDNSLHFGKQQAGFLIPLHDIFNIAFGLF